jgi:hypothetical protein
MSRFYLLPARAETGAHFADYLKERFPGLEWTPAGWADLADWLGQLAADRPDVFVVYRDQLPEGEDVVTALTDGFGAVAGDEVIEVLLREDSVSPRRWRLGAAA